MKLFLVLLILFSNVYAAEVSLYAINSPFPLNWSTPRTLLTSTLKSSIDSSKKGHSNHTIGHAYLGLKCDGESEIISGMTSGTGFSSRTNLFKNGHGLSIILQDNPGHFQDIEESKKDVEFYSFYGKRMATMKIIIPNEQCLKAKEWYTKFSARVNPIYGGVARRPLTGEGSGCTAYTMSYFEYANINFAFFNKIFEQTIYLPKTLLGGEFGPNNVRISDITSNRQLLNAKSEESLEVKLYDPNRMYYWIISQNANSPELSNYKTKVETWNNSKVLVLEPIQQ